MSTQNHKMQRKVARRKDKVERMIQEQRVELDSLQSVQEDYYRKRRSVQAKLSRLEQELRSLEAGRLPGAWG